MISSGNLWLIVISLCLFSNVIVQGNVITSILFIENLKYFILLLPYFIIFAFKLKLPVVKMNNYLWIAILIVVLEAFRISDDTLVKIIRLIALFPLLYIYNGIFIPKRNVKLALVMFLCLIVYYSYVQNWFLGFSFRAVYNSSDPNVSSMYILFAFFLAQKMKLVKISILLVFIGALTISRNFIIAIFLFYLVSFFKDKLWIFGGKTLTLFNMTVISSIAIVILSFTLFNTNNYSMGSGADSQRLTNINDESNHSRFKVNREAINSLASSPETFFYGLGLNYHSNSQYKVAHKVHNGFLDATATYGLLFSFFTLFLASMQIKRNVENLPYLLSYGFFTSFLPGLMATIYLIVFVLILSVKESSDETINNRTCL